MWLFQPILPYGRFLVFVVSILRSGRFWRSPTVAHQPPPAAWGCLWCWTLALRSERLSDRQRQGFIVSSDVGPYSYLWVFSVVHQWFSSSQRTPRLCLCSGVDSRPGTLVWKCQELHVTDHILSLILINQQRSSIIKDALGFGRTTSAAEVTNKLCSNKNRLWWFVDSSCQNKSSLKLYLFFWGGKPATGYWLLKV